MTRMRQVFHMQAFVDYMRFCAGSKEAVEQFSKVTKHTVGKTPIDRMIDAATGHDRIIVRDFIEWCAGQYGKKYLPKDYAEQIMSPSP